MEMERCNGTRYQTTRPRVCSWLSRLIAESFTKAEIEGNMSPKIGSHSATVEMIMLAARRILHLSL